MRIAIIGASGQIGAFIRDEALTRGHEVTAIVRHPEKITARNPRLTVVKADVLKDTHDQGPKLEMELFCSFEIET